MLFFRNEIMANPNSFLPGEEFAQDQQVLLAVLQQLDAGIAVFDDTGHYIFVNDKYCSIYGYAREELLGKTFLVLVPPHEHIKYDSMIDEIANQRGKHSGERILCRRDKSVVTIQFTTENIFNNQKRYTLVTVNDISGIATMRNELDQSEVRFRSLIENTAAREEKTRKLIMNSALDAIICLDIDGGVTLWNPQAEKIFGWSADEVMGKKLSNIIIPDPYREMHDKGMERYKTTREGKLLNKMLELSAMRRSGEIFPIELTVLPLNQDGEDIFCAFIRDISERKQSEAVLQQMNDEMSRTIAELAKSNIELEQFAYVASHDLQEPLRMVSSFLTQIDRKYGDNFDEKGRQYLNFAVDGAIRMRKIIHDLLEYSRADRLETALEPVDLNAIVSEILKVNSSEIEQSHAKITVSKLPEIRARKISMQQLFQNLINNALKYRNENPRIGIGSSDAGDFWQFYVSDNGLGIEQRFHDKVFVIFQRLHNREDYSGTGIGLAICKKIVESYGGRIWIESKPGEGSTFYFTIRK